MLSTRKIKIHVVANAKKAEIIKISENEFKIKIDEVPEKGKANKRLIEILSDYLKIPKTKIQITKGLASNKKIVTLFN